MNPAARCVVLLFVVYVSVLGAELTIRVSYNSQDGNVSRDLKSGEREDIQLSTENVFYSCIGGDFTHSLPDSFLTISEPYSTINSSTYLIRIVYFNVFWFTRYANCSNGTDWITARIAYSGIGLLWAETSTNPYEFHRLPPGGSVRVDSQSTYFINCLSAANSAIISQTVQLFHPNGSVFPFRNLSTSRPTDRIYVDKFSLGFFLDLPVPVTEGDEGEYRCVNVNADNQPENFTFTLYSGSDPCDLTSCPDFSVCDNSSLENLCQCQFRFLEYRDARCRCHAGFSLNATSPPISCSDINECLVSPDPCHLKAANVCVNTEGSYRCECPLGQSSVGDTCQHQCDILNCSLLNNKVCQRNVTGNFSCQCIVGYVALNSSHCSPFTTSISHSITPTPLPSSSSINVIQMSSSISHAIAPTPSPSQSPTASISYPSSVSTTATQSTTQSMEISIVQDIVNKENATFIETLQAIEILQNLSIGIGDNNTALNNDIFETLVNASSGLIMNLERFSSKVSNDVIDFLVDILSNLIAFDETRSNASTAPMNDGKTGVLLTSLIQGVEIVGRISLVGLEGNVTERVFISERVVLVSQRIPYENGTSEFLTIPQSDSVEIFESVSIPGTVVRDLSSEEEFRYSIALIKVISNISNSNSEESLGSNLLSLTVSTELERKKLTSPIWLRFFTPKSKNLEARCVFLDIQNSTYVSNGLSLNSSDGNSTLCVSTHFTSFGVLIRSKPHPVEREESLALSIVSYVLLSASLIALIISIIIFIVNGKEFFQVEMNRIYFNYALALALAIFIFLFGIQATTIHPIACGASVFLLHYFWLAVFSWSLCVSIEIIYLLWITALDRKNLFWFLLPFGWGLPVPIVVISVAVRHNIYIQQPIEHCFLSYSEGLIWSFIGPILVLLFLNLIALIMACIKIVIVTRNLSEKRGTVSNWEVAKQSLINSSILFPVLGVPWIILPISLFVNSFHATTLFEWLFTIFNSPSGILFFVLCTLKYDFVREKIFRRKTGNSSNQKSNPNTSISNNEKRRNFPSKNTLPKPRMNSGTVNPTPFNVELTELTKHNTNSKSGCKELSLKCQSGRDEENVLENLQAIQRDLEKI